MQRRITWTHFLLIGISAILILCGGCDTETEYKVSAELVFINNSESTINYSGLFTIEPSETMVISLEGESGDKSVKIAACCQGFLEDFQGSYQQVYLTLNSSECLLFEENEGPTTLNNYEQEVVGRNDFRYTYSFTEDQFAEAELCN